jgi:hypothetical protein
MSACTVAAVERLGRARGTQASAPPLHRAEPQEVTKASRQCRSRGLRERSSGEPLLLLLLLLLAEAEAELAAPLEAGWAQATMLWPQVRMA